MNITRRDTIVIAALCNVLILVAVIAIANRTQHQKEEVVSHKIQAIEPLQHIEERVSSKKNDPVLSFSSTQNKVESEPPSYLFDEIDQLLEEYGTLKEEPTFSREPSKKSVSNEASVPVNKNTILKEKKSASIKNTPSKSSPSNTASPKPSIVPDTKQQKKTTPVPLRTYTVQQGDNPWTIAKKCKISVDTLLRLNHLDEVKAKNLKIGQILIIQDAQDEDDLNSTSKAQERFRYPK